MQITVTQELAGERLDSLVTKSMPQISRAFIQKLCGEGKVLVNGVGAKPGYKTRLSDQVVVNYDQSASVVPDIQLPILYEDEDCVVIDKPAGVLTHALGKHGQEASVASFLRSRVSDLTGDRAGVVHRLDRATSGVLIGAKNQAALSWLQKQFAQRRTKKSYIAIVDGQLDPSEAVIDMPVERNPKAPATFWVGRNGKSAITHYKVLQESHGKSLVELRPETGRTHQLRVHLAKIGHPIVGDPLYGKGSYGDRLFLHAGALEITLLNKERLTFRSPLPKEFVL